MNVHLPRHRPPPVTGETRGWAYGTPSHSRRDGMRSSSTSGMGSLYGAGTSQQGPLTNAEFNATSHTNTCRSSAELDAAQRSFLSSPPGRAERSLVSDPTSQRIYSSQNQIPRSSHKALPALSEKALPPRPSNKALPLLPPPPPSRDTPSHANLSRGASRSSINYSEYNKTANWYPPRPSSSQSNKSTASDLSAYPNAAFKNLHVTNVSRRSSQSSDLARSGSPSFPSFTHLSLSGDEDHLAQQTAQTNPTYQNPEYQSNPTYQNLQYQWYPSYQNPQYRNPQYQNPQYAQAAPGYACGYRPAPGILSPYHRAGEIEVPVETPHTTRYLVQQEVVNRATLARLEEEHRSKKGRSKVRRLFRPADTKRTPPPPPLLWRPEYGMGVMKSEADRFDDDSDDSASNYHATRSHRYNGGVTPNQY
jgi:hypothetical protein